MGSFIHSHGVHFFALAAPDLLLGMDSDPALRNIVGIVQANPDLATKALRVRSLGQKVVEIIGGRGTHPVSLVAGGVAAPLTKEKRETLIKFADEAVATGAELYNISKGVLLQNMELAQSLPLETHYLGTVNNGALDFYEGDLRLMAPDGTSMDFSEDDWTKYLFEESVSTSYAKYVFCRTNEDAIPYRVGPLARLNCVDSIDTPLANAEMMEFRKVAGYPCHQTVMYHYARLIELLHACEKLQAILKDDEILSENVCAKAGSPRSATAHVEAPRGVLIHDYKVDENAIVTDANLIVATQQNIPSINASVGMSAQMYLDKPDEFLLNAIEFSIRCYDPCLSCATHRYGEMKLDVRIRRNGEPVRSLRR